MSDLVTVEEVELVSVVDGFIPVQGPPGSGLTLLGELPDPGDLPPTGNVSGDGYIINGDLWVWTGDEWTNAGHVEGPQGPQGVQGEPGAQGVQGEQGVQGVQGAPGPTGPTGATGSQGVQGNPGTSTRIVGEVATVAALPPVGSVSVGDSYIVTADGNLRTSTGTVWLDVGQIVGPQGPTGSTGATGSQGPQGIQGVTGAQGVQGIQGATGATGAQGDPGEPGGSLLSAFWTFATSTSSPPSNGQVRSDAGMTQLWVAETDTDGFNRAAGLAAVGATSMVYVRASNGTAINLQITGAPVDNGTWWTFPVSTISGSITKGGRTQLNFVLPQPVGLPAGGTSAQVLTKTSSTDYATSWQALPAATDSVAGVVRLTVATADADAHAALNLAVSPASLANHALLTDLTAKAPIRRTLNAQTGTTYTPVVGDENLMVTLSNAAAITVSLPQNSAAAFPVGAEVDFLWLGAGQPTFTNGTGATVNGTPGLKLRAQYSAATAKKISTNGWVIIGDLAA